MAFVISGWEKTLVCSDLWIIRGTLGRDKTECWVGLQEYTVGP